MTCDGRTLFACLAVLAVFTTQAPASTAPGGGRCVMPDYLARAETWQRQSFDGIRENEFDIADGEIRIHSSGSASLIYADVSGLRFDRLSWTWMSDGKMPASDLRRKGADDRRLSVTVGFAYEDPDPSFWEQMKRDMARALYGDSLPGRAISYTWAAGGEAVGDTFDSPYVGADGKVAILRTGDGGSDTTTVDPKADYRRLFGGPVPPITRIAIFSDTDDTGTTVESRLSHLCLF